MDDIETLGGSLDNKISIFVKLLMSLKQAQGRSKKDEGMNKLLGSLIGAISKMIHELTEDTKNLCDIKGKLTDEYEEEE